jgi:hypothetical protein
MSEHKRYFIQTVDDFFLVPVERREQCLKEFVIFMATAQLVRDIAAEVATPDAIRRNLTASAFEWIDDGELNVGIRLETDEQKFAATE